MLKNNMSAGDGYMLYYISFVLYEVVNAWSRAALSSVSFFLKYELRVLNSCLTCNQFVFVATTSSQMIACNGISCYSE